MAPGAQQNIMSDSNNPFGPVIHSYSRAQAIADGVLVDLTERSESIRRTWVHHMACTDTVWAIVERALEKPGQDLEEILHDVCMMAFVSARVGGAETDTVRFKVSIAGETHALKLRVGPGDTPEPVLTLMLPNED